MPVTPFLFFLVLLYILIGAPRGFVRVKAQIGIDSESYIGL